MQSNGSKAHKEMARRRKEDWTDDERAASYGFPSGDIFREWRGWYNKAVGCLKAGDLKGAAAAKARYRAIARKYTGRPKPTSKMRTNRPST